MPRTDERLLLWQKSLPGEVKLAEEVDLRTIAGRYELTGANIVNIVQYICLQVLSRNEHTVDNDLLLEGIKREYQKEGKIV
jgi:hypothetical protein